AWNRVKSIYLDHNATTPLRPEVREAWLDATDRVQGNPSSVHSSGRAARALVDEARERIAGALGVLEDELLFTSGGTEADNLAILGGMASLELHARLITSRVEHPAVLEAARSMEESGRSVEWLDVSGNGDLSLEELVSTCTGRDLLALMAANNETGNLTDLEQVNALLEQRFGAHRPLFFTDAVQALGRIPVTLRKWGVDLASFSAHKLGGPLGVGILYRKQGTPLEPRHWGGGQEGGLRAGTENVPGIVGASVAVELAVKEQVDYAQHTRGLIHKLWKQLVEKVPGVRCNGPEPTNKMRLPNTLNVLLPDTEGQVLVTRLDRMGLQASAGSACASGSLEPSHVLKAMGLSDQEARAGLRLSLGLATTDATINDTVDILSKVCANDRNC
ncbi:MAG: cysteine desulfurase, partial [Planctomycetes bacterium]|nr:cysteine desulfurase [Planctomycetota bacterium]